MTQQQAILATLVVYKVVLILIGIAASRRTHDGTDFFLGGRGLGPVVAALSASASSSSVWTLLGVSGAAYAWGRPQPPDLSWAFWASASATLANRLGSTVSWPSKMRSPYVVDARSPSCGP